MTDTNTTVRVVGVIPAESPADGGRWALLCEHLGVDGEWHVGGIIQDTNKRRLSGWKTSDSNDGLTGWCPACQEIRDGVAE